jgi:uncharacterized protein
MATEDGKGPPVVGPMRIVVLREREGSRLLPIWVGAPEGDALALQLGGEAMPRPLTADLMASLLEAAGARVERVMVSSLRERTFYATIALASGGKAQEIDARPSDALNLAIRVGAPIFVADEFMSNAVAEDLDSALAREEASLGSSPCRAASGSRSRRGGQSPSSAALAGGAGLVDPVARGVVTR